MALHSDTRIPTTIPVESARPLLDARGVGQHAVEIEDRSVEVAPAYRD